MNFPKRRLISIVFFLILLISIPLGLYLARQTQTGRSRASEGVRTGEIALNASTTIRNTSGFQTKAFTFNKPGSPGYVEKYNFKGMRGSVSMTTDITRYSKVVLLQIYAMPSDKPCPDYNNTEIDIGRDLQEKGARGLYSHTLKNQQIGLHTVSNEINFDFPKSIARSGCVIVAINGAELANSNDPTTFSVNLRIVYDTDPTKFDSKVGTIGLGWEYLWCYISDEERARSRGSIGDRHCKLPNRDRITRNIGFATNHTGYWNSPETKHIFTKPTTLYGLYGSIGGYTLDGSHINNGGPTQPNGPWQIYTDFYILKSKSACDLIPEPGFADHQIIPFDYLGNLPRDAQLIHTVVSRGNGASEYNDTVYKTFDTPILIQPGSCLININTAETQSGEGLDVELQVGALIEEQYTNAQFIRQNIPTSMNTGQTSQVSITMKNNGQMPWTKNGNFRLGIEKQETNHWGIGRVDLNDGETINPGQEKTFTFNITAPSTPGRYNFQWRVVQEGVEWFGQETPSVQISVVQNIPAPKNARVVCSGDNRVATILWDRPDNAANYTYDYQIYKQGVSPLSLNCFDPNGTNNSSGSCQYNLGSVTSINQRVEADTQYTLNIATRRGDNLSVPLTTLNFSCGGGASTPSPSSSPTDRRPVGYFDEADNTSCKIRGWAKDEDEPNKRVKIHVYKDVRDDGSGGQWLAEFTADKPQGQGESLGGNYRYEERLALNDNQDHKISVYALNSAGTNNNALLNNSPKTIHCPASSTLIQSIIQLFGGAGNQGNGDQNNDGKINELDFGAVYSR